jgi:hypothetical protein
MKAYLTLLSFILFISLSNAQVDYLFIQDKSEKLQCKEDTIISFKSWFVYQTEDDNVNGVIIDSCLDLSKDISSNRLRPDKSLFIKFRYDSLNFSFIKNSIYYLGFELGTDKLIFDTSATPKLFITIETIDSTGQVTELSNEFSAYYIHNGCAIIGNKCITTQKFEIQKLKSIYFKLPLLDQFPLSKIKIDPFSIFINEYFTQVDSLNALSAASISNLKLNIKLNELVSSSTPFDKYILVHTREGLPSSTNKDLKIVKINPNPTEVVDVNLRLQPDEDLYLQQFTGFDTEKALNSQEKHHFTLDVGEGNMCLQIAELIIDKNQTLLLSKGRLEMSDNFACLQVKNQGRLVIEESNRQILGYHGTGMYLFNQGVVEVKENSTLHFDGILLLKAENKMHLKKNASINFTPHCIINPGEHNGNLTIYGWKSQVNLNSLSQEEQQYIVIIEPQLTKNEAIRISPNPAQDFVETNINFAIDAPKLVGIDGVSYPCKLIESNTLDVSELPNGMYIITVGNQKGKFLKM